MGLDKHVSEFKKLREKFTLAERKGYHEFIVPWESPHPDRVEGRKSFICSDGVEEILEPFDINFKKDIEIRTHKNPLEGTLKVTALDGSYVRVSGHSVDEEVFLKDWQQELELGFVFYISFWQ